MALFLGTSRLQFQPNQIAGLTLWLDAQDVCGNGNAVASGTTVVNWKNKVNGASIPSTGTGAAVLTANAINSNQAIRFSGTQAFTPASGSVSNTGTTMTTYVVATLDVGSSNDSRLISCTNGDNVDYNRADSFAIVRTTMSSNIVLSSFRGTFERNFAGVTNTPFYFRTIHTGTSSGNIMTGNAEQAAVTNLGSFSYNTCRIGDCAGTGMGSIPWKGAIGEVLHYTTALSTTQLQQLTNYLAAKWGVAV